MRTLLLIALLIGLNVKAQFPKNLILEGGGIRGIAYTGALEVLDSANMLDSVERIAGTSSGAITGVLYAVGFEPEEITNIMLESKIHKFNDVGVPLFGGVRRLRKNFGYYSTEKFAKELNKIFKLKSIDPELTFMQLHELRLNNSRIKDIYITGTSLNRQESIIFSYESYPHMKILDALRISISIPLYFEAIFINEMGAILESGDTSACDIMVDGAFLANYPFYLFDELKYDSLGHAYYVANPMSLGLKLERSDQVGHGVEIAPYRVENVKDFIGSIYNLGFENLNRNHLTDQHFMQTIVINNLDINPRVRKVSKEERTMLINSGRQSIRDYLGE